PNDGGRVLGEDGQPLERTYATGWIKRGPVGLIGSTKSDASETIQNLLAEFSEGHRPAPSRDEEAITSMLRERGVDYTTWHGWELLDTHERALGEAAGRERIKVVPRE